VVRGAKSNGGDDAQHCMQCPLQPMHNKLNEGFVICREEKWRLGVLLQVE
jgi:hypothetical protein